MSDDRTQKCYNSDDHQWWELPVDQYEQMLLLNYSKIAHPPESDHDHANLSTSTASQLYPDPWRNTQCYPISSASSVSRKPPTQPAGPTRQKRRRGRGGTAAATTFLNSTITNFRQLVQLHTGMGPTAPTTTTSSYYYASCNQKSPITLCFANYSSSSSTSESALGFNHGSSSYHQ